MSVTNLKDLFVHTLKDIYYAEKRILRALPKMIEKAENSKLRRAFESHRSETQEQVSRLETVFGLIGEEAVGEKCPAIDGILKEAEELMDEVSDAATLDAAMLSAAQAVEHYEITRYGSLITWAQELGLDDAVGTLRETLAEEKSADAALTHLAEHRINANAMAG